MAFDLTDLLAMLLFGARQLLVFVALVFLASSLDDLFIDVCYFVRAAWRGLTRRKYVRTLSERRLLAEPQQPIAVLIPAWDESAVIRPMLTNVLRSVNYENFHVFVGTYPNDPDTMREVEAVRRHFPNVHRIDVGAPGPTNKAHCLNQVWRGIGEHERRHGIEFQIFVMHDCEDVIDPLAFRLLNHLIPRKDMVQLPVLPLPTRWWDFTSGHYIDEFAQLHYKDLLVREALDGSVPAAGVGCGFSRRAFLSMAASRDQELFSTRSLTEDYDFGFRLKTLGMRQIFARCRIVRDADPAGDGRAEMVCIREYFPSRFRAAVRQKSRWVLGIALQGWREFGWMGGLVTRYMLYRDRKSLLTNVVNVLGYAVVAAVVGAWAADRFYPEGYRFPPLVQQGEWLWWVLVANGALLLGRLALRAWCVGRLFGPVQALLSVPRAVWGNFINFFATLRAVRQFTRSLLSGRAVAWDKTAHRYPTAAAPVPAEHGAPALAKAAQGSLPEGPS